VVGEVPRDGFQLVRARTIRSTIVHRSGPHTGVNAVRSSSKVVSTILIGVSLSCPVTPAESPVKRTVLERMDVHTTNAPLECVLGTAELRPGASIGRHSHAGLETGYVLEGELRLEVEGEPPRVLGKNATYRIEAGRVHDATNIGSSPLRVLGTWVVEKGKPLSQPAK
jgi:quercetin dioxygenase-like cupin family protein